jgi:hypothetical protein
MYTFFLILTIAVIISQTIHVYYVFNSFSRLTGWLRTFQAVMFCSIISLSILGFVLIGKDQLALLGALIEIVVNIYYYAMDFFENGIRARVNRKIAIITFWRKSWVAIFFGLLIPTLIYVFALQMIILK